MNYNTTQEKEVFGMIKIAIVGTGGISHAHIAAYLTREEMKLNKTKIEEAYKS